MLETLRLKSIRSQILVFSLFATLLPSISMGWLSYRNNAHVLEEKISKDLTSITSQTSREIDLWLKERQYEIKVFASSYEVAENLAKGSAGVPRLGDYLKAVKQRFADYDELAVFDPKGALVATTVATTDLALPKGWEESLKATGMATGEPYWNASGHVAAFILAEPVGEARERPAGFLAARVNLRGIDAVLKNQAHSASEQLFVTTRTGMVLSRFPADAGATAPAQIPIIAMRTLFSGQTPPIDMNGLDGQACVGALQTAARLPWGVVAAKSRATEYAEMRKVRNWTIALTAAIVAGVGLAAALLGLILVRPLDRVIKGAGKVAAGDLEVDLPVAVGGEIGYLTVVFNRMVGRLRKAREEIEATNLALVEKNRELHEVSITDGLTGLNNRKHMNETVVSELKRAERHAQPVAILMMDIDKFKTYNDTRGHQGGDELLRRLAKLLKETLRATDYAARYGGEEFLVLLPLTACKDASETAEKIRRRMEESNLGTYGDGSVATISIGVATSPECGFDPEKVIREADMALYRAKRDGRNRVVTADAP
ncbi:MAG TPA: diguanylate cyclase, partial [Verrucomicrobiae bacterium]|nr:diguanylate cyclase [Verrucomicrobiae bacterium]